MKRNSLPALLQRASIATTITELGTLSGSCASTPSHAAFLSATPSTLTYAPAVAVHLPPSTSASACPSPPLPSGANDNSQGTNVHLDIPAPHALGTGYIHIPIAIPASVVSPSPPEPKSGIEEVDDKDVIAEEDKSVHSVRVLSFDTPHPLSLQASLDPSIRRFSQSSLARCVDLMIRAQDHVFPCPRTERKQVTSLTNNPFHPKSLTTLCRVVPSDPPSYSSLKVEPANMIYQKRPFNSSLLIRRLLPKTHEPTT